MHSNKTSLIIYVMFYAMISMLSKKLLHFYASRMTFIDTLQLLRWDASFPPTHVTSTSVYVATLKLTKSNTM